MSTQGRFSWLHLFDFGNRDPNNPGVNILSVTSQADGDFDKANLTTESLRHAWRSDSIIDWQDIVIKADLTTRVDTVGILGHNLTEDAVVQVQANISDNWVAPAISFTVPWSKGNMVLCEDFGAAYGYYRIRILDPSNPCGYVQVGRIVGGRAYTMAGEEDITDDISYGWDDKADVMKTEGFFRVGNENVKPKAVRVSVSKLRTVAPDAANYEALIELADYVGKTKPFLAIVDRSEPGFLSVWGQLDDLPSPRFDINRYASFGITISEVF